MRILYLAVALVLLGGCDTLTGNVKTDAYEIWDGQYGGAADITVVEADSLRVVREDTEVILEIEFETEGVLEELSLEATSEVDPERLTNIEPTKMTNDSLIVAYKEGKYQTDYVLSKRDNEVNGQVRIFEQDSEGRYFLESFYEFNVSKTEEREIEN